MNSQQHHLHQAYGMPIRETDEAACVAWLIRLYQEKVGELEEKNCDNTRVSGE